MMIYTEKVIPFENRAGGKGTGILRIAMEDEQLEGRAKAIMSVTLHPGSSIGSHQHVGNLEIYYVLKGEGIFTVNGKSEPIHAGQAGSMNPGDWHSIENTGSEDMLISAVILYE
ncbi:MAG TPA: cupin domain-containing protein [Candidatus Lachnoclostridium avicola]|nr:cupin domain-containing protein [Candidatus Lachnoclostridium avicola]